MKDTIKMSEQLRTALLSESVTEKLSFHAKNCPNCAKECQCADAMKLYLDSNQVRKLRKEVSDRRRKNEDDPLYDKKTSLWAIKEQLQHRTKEDLQEMYDECNRTNQTEGIFYFVVKKLINK